MAKKRGKNPLKEMFGTFRFKGNAEKLLKEVDKELWGEWKLSKKQLQEIDKLRADALEEHRKSQTIPVEKLRK